MLNKIKRVDNGKMKYISKPRSIEGFGTLVGSPIYTTAYNMTIHNFANFIFLLSSVFGTFVLGLYM